MPRSDAGRRRLLSRFDVLSLHFLTDPCFSAANLRVAHRLGRQPRVASANFGLRTTRASGGKGSKSCSTKRSRKLRACAACAACASAPSRSCSVGRRCGSSPLGLGSRQSSVPSNSFLFSLAPVAAPWGPQRPGPRRPRLQPQQAWPSVHVERHYAVQLTGLVLWGDCWRDKATAIGKIIAGPRNAAGPQTT